MEEDRFTRITLRIPKELHGRIAAAADAATHSQNAEIVQRLEQSFERPHSEHVQAGKAESREFIELMTAAMQSQVEMQSMRIAMAKMRLQAQIDRLEYLSREIELETKAAQTDEDFARLDEKVSKLTANKATLREIEDELHAIVQERDLLLTQLQNGLELVRGARESAEARLREIPVIAPPEADTGTHIKAAHKVRTQKT